MLPHRLEENLSFCPRDVTTYAALHLDSISKILNHILLLLFAFNTLLFLACWSQSFSPNNSLPVLWISFFLLLHNSTVWAILNNGRLPSTLAFLRPNEFIMGVALGITIGASILSFVLSHSFRYGTCTSPSRSMNRSGDYSPTTTTTSQPACNHSTGIWLWAGLVFWLNFCACLLLAVGRREFTHSGQYEQVGTAEPGYANNSVGYNNYPQPTFAGDYATVPEVRPDHDTMNNSSHGSVSSRSEAAKILSV